MTTTMLRETPPSLKDQADQSANNWFDPRVTSVPAIRPRTSAAHVPICMATGNSFPDQVTIGSTITAEVPFTGVRLILVNHSPKPLACAGMCVAPSASAASPLLPQDEAGNATTWFPVTVNGAKPVVPPGSNERPSIVVTDIVPIESLGRIDEGNGFLLFTRAAGPAGEANYINQTSVISSTTEFNRETPGRPISNWYVGGDYASSPAEADLGATTPTVSMPFYIVGGAIFLSTDHCITLMGVGDSLTQGLTAGIGYSGFARHAASLLSTPSLGVSFVDAGYSGQTTEQFTTRATDLINAGIPVDILTVPIDSPNDYAAGISRVRQEATILSFVDFALSKNIAVVLVTSIPCNAHAGDAGNGGQRVISSTKLRRSLRSGLMLLDAQSIISGYVPTQLALPAAPPDLLGGDGVHLNAAAHAMLGAELATMLMPCLR